MKPQSKKFIVISLVQFLIFLTMSYPLETIDLSMPDSIISLIERGEFTKASQQLHHLALEEKDMTYKHSFRWEAERLRRIALDYPLTRSDLFQQLKQRVRDVRQEDMRQWIEEGRFDWLKIDGIQRFLSPGVSNLFFAYPDIRQRRLIVPSNANQRFPIDLASHYTDKSSDYSAFTSPIRFSVEMTLTVKPDTVPEGDRIRCWLPVPQDTAFQKNVEIISATPESYFLASSNQPHRSVYLERLAVKNQPSVFAVRYAYSSIPRYIVIDESKITRIIPEDVKPFLREEPPHIRFLPEFQTLLESIVGEETNPYRIAKAIYDWMSDTLHYRYAPEYSTIRNISWFTYSRRYGDCGQMALLYMTLCRMTGIPARWESGWMFYPHLTNLHDWCVIYLDPYGWIPVDPTMAVLAMNYWEPKDSSLGERNAVKDFFLGNMDAYRMAANSNHGDAFDPLKKHLRSDTVDFQRGEVETESGNIYYDQFDYKLSILSKEFQSE